MVSALVELREYGRLGPDGVEALYQAIAAVARFDHYPPPEGYKRWNADAVRDAAANFVAGPRSTERLMQLAILATDERSFLRLLEAAVRNSFRSEARRTAGGKLYRRLRGVLEEAEGIVQVSSDVFALEGETESVERGLLDYLIPSTWNVEIDSIPGRLDADGNIKISRLALERLCRAILNEAGGPLDLDAFLYLVGARLGLREAPLVADVDTSAPTRRPDDEAVDRLTAEGIFEELSARERVALIVLEDSVRDAANFAGIGKSSMAELMARLRSRLEVLLPEDSGRGPVLARLVEMALAWSGEARNDGPDK
jgi:hypothetical protein